MLWNKPELLVITNLQQTGRGCVGRMQAIWNQWFQVDKVLAQTTGAIIPAN